MNPISNSIEQIDLIMKMANRFSDEIKDK